jgi:hypothetical protein
MYRRTLDRKQRMNQTVVVHIFKPSTQEAEAGKSEFEAKLADKESSRRTNENQETSKQTNTTEKSHESPL